MSVHRTHSHPARRALLLGAALFCATIAAGGVDAQTQGSASGMSEERFRDWMVRCGETPDPAGARCLAFTTTPGAQLIVAGVDTRRADAPPARIVVHVPRQVQVGEPVAVYLDSDVAFQLRVGRCTERYCEAQVAPDAVSSVLPRLIADTKGVIIYTVENDILLVPFSLAEFDKAWRQARP